MLAWITKEIVQAVERAERCTREHAVRTRRDLAELIEKKPALRGSMVEHSCLSAAEEHEQTADVLAGWARRQRVLLEMPSHGDVA